MYEKISKINITYPKTVIFTFLLITVVLGLFIPRAEIEPDIKRQLPTDFKSIINLDKVEEIFGGIDMAMIIFETDDVLNPDTLRRMKKISRGVKRIKGVDKVLSLFELKDIRGEDGAMIVDPAVRRIPKTPEGREKLREALKNNDQVYGSVVSEDFKASCIIAMLKNESEDNVVAAGLKKLAEKYPGEEIVHFGGMPVNRIHIATDMKSDMRRFLPFGLLIMLIFLYLCFKELRGVFLPFIVVVMSIIVVFGLIPIIGWKIQMVTVLLPVILIAVANDYGIHLISKYQEDNYEGNNYTSKEIATNVYRSLGRPVIAAGITTMAGLMCLLSHVIVPAEQLGILASIGILYALLASLMFIPAVLSILPKGKPIITKDKNRGRLVEKALHRVAAFVTNYPKAIIVVSLILALLISYGIKSIIVDTSVERYYTEDSEVVRASNALNSKLGGSQVVTVVANGDIKDPKVLKQIDELEMELKSWPGIGITTSIARVIRQMSRALNDEGEEFYDKIPDTRNAVSQYFELYSMSGDPEDFEKLVDFPYKNAQVTARVTLTSSSDLKNLINRVKDRVKDSELFVNVSGFSTIFSELVDEVISGQIVSLSLSLIIIVLFVMVMFKSFWAGIVTGMPIGMALLLLFGLMGYSGIELNVATALLSSIMVGVGVDYTIHFLWRYREEREAGKDPREAVQRTLETSGRGIFFNALSVIIGFVVLLVSNFLPVKFFGFLVVVSITTCLIAALVLLPAICIVFRPKFLEPKEV